MNKVLILCLLAFVVKADYLEEDSLLSSESGPDPEITDIERSFLDLINPGHNGQPITGRFVYTDDDGQQFDVSYFADVYGYQAQGRLVDSTHPFANYLKTVNDRITLEGK